MMMTTMTMMMMMMMMMVTMTDDDDDDNDDDGSCCWGYNLGTLSCSQVLQLIWVNSDELRDLTTWQVTRILVLAMASGGPSQYKDVVFLV